jgi:hypothetical protein
MNKQNETVGLSFEQLFAGEALSLEQHQCRELAEEELGDVSGGLMALSRTTCSCGCADDCGQ